jgi:hypothetical protein
MRALRTSYHNVVSRHNINDISCPIDQASPLAEADLGNGGSQPSCPRLQEAWGRKAKLVPPGPGRASILTPRAPLK